ncbi:C-type lectin domain family 4 member E-like [Conger conger]|uniref:C-type lectin domain family 4 member E-like n=1 Tax=Conger conger TaxID=82655 RepID=UPI002A5B0E9D|nr:C-type lectin domain family 4 member E-like [Conger conger]
MDKKLTTEDINELRLSHCYSKTRDKVFMVRATNGPSSQIFRVTTVILGILCAVLMATIIGLCISFKGLTEKHILLSQNSVANNNLTLLMTNYAHLTSSLMTLQTNYQEVISFKDSMQRERDRDKQEQNLLQEQKESLLSKQAELRSRVTELEQSCSRCPAGWELLQSSCYFFSPVDTRERLSWYQSRERCNTSGADLVVIDSQGEQEFIQRILKGKRVSPGEGYWIGLSDVQTEGEWKWLDGTELTQGFWLDGEPNDQYSREDCAGTYKKENPLKTWNDAPCSYPLKWICEMKMNEP